MITPEDLDKLLEALGFRKILDISPYDIQRINNCKETCGTVGGAETIIEDIIDIYNIGVEEMVFVIMDFEWAWAGNTQCNVEWEISVDAIGDIIGKNLFKSTFSGSCIAPI